MSLCWVTLPVKNLEASLAFYHEVMGLPINSKHSGHGMEMAMLGEEDQPKIELICMSDEQKKDLHSDISVGLAVESLNSAMGLLKKNQIAIVRGPISPAPNIRFLFIHDPDGYTVQLVEIKNL